MNATQYAVSIWRDIELVPQKKNLRDPLDIEPNQVHRIQFKVLLRIRLKIGIAKRRIHGTPKDYA